MALEKKKLYELKLYKLKQLIIQLWLSKKNFTKTNFTNQSSSCGSRRKHEVPRDARAERKQVGLKEIKKDFKQFVKTDKRYFKKINHIFIKMKKIKRSNQKIRLKNQDMNESVDVESFVFRLSRCCSLWLHFFYFAGDPGQPFWKPGNIYVFRFIMETLLKLGFLEFTHSVYYYRVVFFLLPFVHAIINPLIYITMSKHFRCFEDIAMLIHTICWCHVMLHMLMQNYRILMPNNTILV